MSPKDQRVHPTRPIQHARAQSSPAEGRSRPTRTHPKYSGFHPKPRRPGPQNDISAKDLSKELQGAIQRAANDFSAQIIRTADELVNNASATVQADIQQAAGAIQTAIHDNAENIEIDIENTAAEITYDIEDQVYKYLNPASIEAAAIRIVHNLAHAAIGAHEAIMSSNSNVDDRDDEEDPLLPRRPGHEVKNYINVQHWIYPETAQHVVHTTRDKVRHWLCSKAGHYCVLGIVGLDVAGIVAAFIIDLFKCEKRWGDSGWDEALTALDIISLVFSCLFMLELLASIWAFGLGYFKSKFHIVDSLVVVGGFILDLSLHGAIEEAASLIVVLRLWRVFKIIEELSVGAQEQVNDMDAEIVRLETENLALKREGESLKTEMAAVKADLAALKEQGEKSEPAKD